MKRLCRISWRLAAWLAIGSCAMAEMPGDADHDGDVDFDDFALLSACQSGPDVPAIGTCQELFDFDLETDVDMTDVASFQRCFSGANLSGNPDCASHLLRIENGCLHIIGTAADTLLTLRLQAGAPNSLQIDVGNDGSAEFTVNRSLFHCIVVDARGGNDQVLIDEVNGVFTDTEITTINGGDGNDTLLGASGSETMNGGPGNDTVFLGPGNDRFIWNPGDGTDLIEGGDGIDVVEINGGNSAEVFTVTANGTRVRFDRVSPAPFFLDIGACESLLLNANGGNDSLACTGNLAALIQITADGGPGDDTLLGSNGVDVLIGGDDHDFIDGNQGNDTALLGAGDDTFQWDPGDGSDIVEGQQGEDLVVFNGSNIGELFEFSASGNRLRFTRNIGNIVLDANDIEQFDLQTLGGADTVTVHNLAATDLAQINVDLAATLGGTNGDAAADNVIVNGTPLADAIQIAANLGAVNVTGLAAAVRITHAEVANDRLTVNGLEGVDTITPGPGVTTMIMLTINP